MNKKTHITMKVLLLYISIILMFTTVVSSENEATGFTVSSIDSVPIISNNKDLARANFTLTLIANGGGQSVIGNFGNETFSKILTNLVIKYPLKIEIGNIKESVTYQILNQGQLYKYEYHYIQPKSWLEGAKCDGSTYCFPINDAWTLNFGIDKILAVNRVPIGMYGAFGNPDISWSGKITVTINGIPISKDISSGVNSAGSVNFNGITGEFVANAKWVGSLTTGQSTPNQNNYLPTYQSNSKTWQIAPKTYYEIYKKSLDETDITFNTWKVANYGYLSDNDFIYVCQDSICSKVLNYINVHNENLKTLINANEKIGYESTLSSSTITSVENKYPIRGSVTDILDRKIGNPVIIMVVAAKELHPYIPTGIPKIELITSETFNSGDGKGEVYIRIKNIGNSKGTFAAFLNEETGTFTDQSNIESTKITLESQQSGTVKININYGVNLQNISKTGIITVYDVNFPDEKTTTSKEFTINMNSPKICQPNAYRTFGDEVYKCNNDGTEEIKVLDCNNNLIKFVGDVPICEEVNKNNNPNIYEKFEQILPLGDEENEKGKEKEKGKEQNNELLINTLYWLIGFFIITFTLIIINMIRNNEPKPSKKNIDNSLLLAGIIVGLLYLYIQYIAIESTLGIMLWTIITIVIIIVISLNILSYIITKTPLTKKVSITIFIGLSILFISIAISLKDIMCESWFTKWLFSNCEKFSLTYYIFGK